MAFKESTRMSLLPLAQGVGVDVVADRRAGLEVGDLLAQQQPGDVAEGARQIVGLVGVEHALVRERRDAP